MKKAADTVTTAAKSIKEEVDRAFQEAAAWEKEQEEEKAESGEDGAEPAEPTGEPVPDLNREIVEDLEQDAKAPDVPTIQVNPEDMEEL